MPENRLAPWNADTVGIPGGIPHRETIYATLNPGDNIQTAVNNCPAGQVVKLNDGTWDISGLTIAKSVTLRGNGPERTILRYNGGNGITIESGVLNGGETALSLSSGYTQGSSNVVTATTSSNLRVGYVVLLDQLNDESYLVYNSGNNGKATWISRESGNRCRSQAVMVTAINGNTVSFWPPLTYHLDATKSPQLYFRHASSTANNYVNWAGVEDLTLTNRSTSSGTGFYINRANYCWLSNVVHWDAYSWHVSMMNGFRNEIRHSTFRGTRTTLNGAGYGISLDNQTCSTLIEDNIIADNRQFVQVNGGGTGNVVAYNYMTNAVASSSAPNYTVKTGGHHNAHPMFNLFEGNIAYKFTGDFTWGSSSHNTFLRNWAKALMPYSSQSGTAFEMDEKASSYNFIGNILGFPSITSHSGFTTFTTLKVSPSTYSYDNQYASFRLGYYSSSDGGGGRNGTNEYQSHIINGNYDYVVGTQTYFNGQQPGVIPASYFHASKPPYFGSLPWPPIDPANPSASIVETNIPAGYRWRYGVAPGAVTNNAPPVVVVSSTLQSGPAPLTIAFSSVGTYDPEGSALSYIWTFGDGTSSTAANPSKTFSAAGAYAVQLTVSDGVNSTDSAILTITVGTTVIIDEPPVAVASASPTLGVAPLVVTFSSAGSFDPEGANLSYSWDFGDGTSSASANPTHTYQSAGTYGARLSVSDGQKTTQSGIMTITATSSSTDSIAGSTFVDFEAGEDGTVMTAAIAASATKGQVFPWHTSSDSGTYSAGSTPNLKIATAAQYNLFTPANINGTLYSGAGVRGMRATQSADNFLVLTFPAPVPKLSVGFYFRWNGPAINWAPRDIFGMTDSQGRYQFLQIYDNASGSQIPYFHTHWQPYSSGNGIGNNVNFQRNRWYWVTMAYATGGGTFRIRFYDAQNNYTLAGESTASIASGPVGATRIVMGQVKYASGGSQSLDFDNFIINTNGVFPLGPGAGGTLPGNQPPVVIVAATPQSGASPLTVVFSSAGTYDPEGSTLNYSWTFGDGTSSTAANPSKTYNNAGNYTARLTVSDGINSVTSANLSISVIAPPAPPQGLRVVGL